MIIPSAGKLINSSCVILVENGDIISLYENSKIDKSYGTLGGRIDDNDIIYNEPILYAAKREAFEESAGSIVITIPVLKELFNNNLFIDIKNFTGNYTRCFFLHIEGAIREEDFRVNLKQIKSSSLLYYHQMNEKSNVKRFYLKDLSKQIKRNYLIITFDKTELIKVSKKVFDILKLARFRKILIHPKKRYSIKRCKNSFNGVNFISYFI